MMLAPAAMFAMFFFLSLFIQQVMGYSPLEAGFAFLPFSFGIVIGAGLASNLVSRIDPRYLAGHRHAARGVLAVHVLAALGRRLARRGRGCAGRQGTAGPT